MAKLGDDAIAARLMYGIGQCTGPSESKLSKERELVVRYRNGELPKKSHEGDSGYTSLDVQEAIESMKAQLLETFSGNGRPVGFIPTNAEDVESAEVRTDYITSVIFDQNPGFQILHDTIDDGLTARVGIVKAWWNTDEKSEFYDLSDVAMHELEAYLADNPTAEIEDYDIDEDGQRIKRVRLKMLKDRSQVRLEVLPPEEFFISPMAKSIEEAPLCGHKQPKTISELIKAGYDKDVVLSLQDDDRLWQEQTPEVQARFQETDSLISRSTDFNDKASRVCTVYECYAELDLEDDGTNQLYKITMVGDTILDKEPVSRKPFIPYIPLPRTHTFWGDNYGKKTIPTQNARTYLTRSIINHALITNNPRLQVVAGGVLNPRELIENRIGGIVNVRRPDAITPIPQQGLNPFIFQTIAMLDEDKEEITGISKLSQGLNKDAISKQNSQGMVQELITVSQVRQKIIARQFAERFLRDLYTMVYQLVVENEDRAKIVQIAGSWVPVDFTKWPEDSKMEVSFALGYGEQDKEVQKWMGIDRYMMSDPGLQAFYPKEKRFNVIKKAMLASGIKDFTNYMLTPQQVQPPPPDPMHQADLAVKQADAQVKMANAKSAVLNQQIAQQELQMKTQQGVAKIELETRKAMQSGQLAQDKLAHQVAVDAAELQMQAEAQAHASQVTVTSTEKPTPV